MIDTSSMNLLIGRHVPVIWRWQWEVASDDLAPSPRGSLHDIGNNEENGNKADNEVDDEEDGDKVDIKKMNWSSKTVIMKCLPYCY